MRCVAPPSSSPLSRGHDGPTGKRPREAWGRRNVAHWFLAALLSACGGSIPRVPTPAELGGLPQVTVALAPEIESDRARVFQEQDGVARLRNAVLDEMIAHRGVPSADEMHLLVTRFRLRSTAAGVGVGAMAGADMLDVNVTLVRGGETMRTFSTGAGSIVAGLIKPSATGRFNGLVKEVAERIVKEL